MPCEPLLRLALAPVALPALASDTSVDALPIYKPLSPTWSRWLAWSLGPCRLGRNRHQNKFGLDIDGHMRETIQTAATNAAGSLIAKMEGQIGNVSIDVKSQIVKDGVDMVIAKGPRCHSSISS